MADVTSSRLSSAELAEQLARDFGRLDDISRVLRLRYNDCCALFKIPPECIAVIFHFLAADEPPQWNVRSQNKAGFPSKLPNTLGFIRLGHVCHRLRATLLNIRSLWASFAFSLSPKAVREMIERAGTIPLSINLKNWEKPPPDVLQAIRDHIHNASVISFPPGALFSQSCAWPFEAKNIHEETFPFLEELTLHFAVLQAQSGNVYQFPPMVAPNLRRISLENVFVPCALSSLDSFKLQFGHDNMDDPPIPPTSVFYDMLRSLSNVQSLTLDNCIPAVPPRLEGFDEDTPSYAFPRLRDLRLGGSIETCQIFWKYLQIPPDTRITMSVEDESDQFPRQLAFLGAISAHFRSPNCPRITALSVDDDQNDMDARLRLVLASSEPGSVQDTWSGPLAKDHRFLLDLTLFGWVFEGFDGDPMAASGPFIELIKRLPDLYDFADLKTIELASLCGFSPGRWKEALSPYKSVTTFAIDPFPPYLGLWEAFSPPSLDVAESHIFPNLEVIAIEKTLDFTHLQIGFDEDDWSMPASWSEFCPGLERRKAAGAGVKRVLFASFLTDDVVRAEGLLKELRATVPEVVGTPTHVERGPLANMDFHL